MGSDPVPPGHRAVTISQLRAAIDAGQTRDKVNYPDPAAAPLGTDDEAAGHPPNASEVSLELIAVPPARESPWDWIIYPLLVVPVALVILLIAATAG
jgi:hypothetical protein